MAEDRQLSVETRYTGWGSRVTVKAPPASKVESPGKREPTVRGTFALAIAGSYALLVIIATIYVEVSTRQPGSQGLEAPVPLAITSPTSQLLTPPDQGRP
ncbi:hypothetical protein OG884_19980 [Streptosporangium sp. NBC_01755]|uniref:hypothetical protein n=1 Tax=unclassified Streptosporangium TaxID=2632669 RepID=UPI002DDB81BE|nr:MULTISPECIES: hypothetical protein [unclassified Streptosporangium]WSA24738.1 hypothetical protein OIE13_27935 [Streptosporangium sp. NBC_01810]WSC97186.1 hypothetical protein OG884_19980 [Streptosporangium sp. NBC_01755]